MRWGSVVDELSCASLHGIRHLIFVLIEVRYAASRAIGCVVRQADVEEAGILSGNELVHIVI